MISLSPKSFSPLDPNQDVAAQKMDRFTSYFCPYSFQTYIPLQRETTRVGSLGLVRPPTRGVRVANTNILVSKKPCGPNANPCTDCFALGTRNVLNANTVSSGIHVLRLFATLIGILYEIKCSRYDFVLIKR